MICNICHSENAEHRLFCSHCGKTLSVVRHSCGFINNEKDNYCGGCGNLIHQNMKTEEETKRIGSSISAEQLSIEDIQEMLADEDFKLKSKSYTLMQNEIDSLFKKP